jgi:hypothetical protein
MPASRSRTVRWRECLDQIRDRGGGIELAFARPEFETPGGDTAARSDLMWRVRVLDVSDDELVVDQPTAIGRPMQFFEGTALLGVMSVGQNRWMFHCKVRGAKPLGVRNGETLHGLRLTPPEQVERCTRRNFLRISTAELQLPDVQCWPLIDPTTAIAAEVANRSSVLDHADAHLTGHYAKQTDPFLLPEVGPEFRARLMNIGGGGAGLIVKREDAAGLDRARFLWVRIPLMPHVGAPLAMTARVAHRHVDSEQNVYAGLAFDFAFHAAHRDFVVEQLSRYVERMQAFCKAA